MMSEFNLSHRACTLPGADPDTDRIVLCDGVPVGRVLMIDAGEQRGLWRWSGLWIGSDTTGTADTLAEGLQEIKRR